MTSPKFRGTFEQLHQVIAQTGAAGQCERMPAGYFRFRCDDGAILNWWPTTGTINFQGPTLAKRRLKEAVADALRRLSQAAPRASEAKKIVDDRIGCELRLLVPPQQDSNKPH